MAKLKLTYFLLEACVLVFFGTAHAATPTLTLQGRITKADGTPFTGSTQFRVQILSPVEQCVLYDETQTKDLTAAEGLFSLSLNDGASGNVRNDSNTWSFQQVLSNKSPFSVSSTFCQSGSGAVVYTPGPSDERKVLVQFKDATMSTWDSMPVATLSHSAMAVDSVQVGGFAASNLLRFAESDGTLVNVSPLNNAQYTALVALVDGTSTQYVKGGSTGAVLPSVTTTPSSTPSAGQIWFNSASGSLQYSTGSAILSVGTSGGSVTSVATGAGLTGGPITSSGTIALATLGSGGTGTKVTYDTYGRVTATAALAETDLPTIATAGKVSGAAITSGTIGGTTVFNTSGDVTTTGTVTAATTTATHAKVRDVQVFDSGTNAVTIQTPTTLASAYTLTLPATAGTSGYVLSTNGSGALSWIAAATGSVTSVTAAAPLASSGGATPNLTIAKATASQDGYLEQGDFATFAGKQSSTLQNNFLWVGNSSNVATGVAVSGDVSLANTGAMTVGGVKGVAVSASPTLSGQTLRYNGTTWTPNFVAMSDLRSTITGAQAVTSCGAGQTLTYTSVTDNLSCATIAIGDSQITYASQAAKQVLAAPVGSAGAPSFRLLTAADLPTVFANGGNSFGGSATLGTNDTNNLALKTDGSTRMTITAAGSVGIGTTSPGSALDVNGAVTATQVVIGAGSSAVYAGSSSTATLPTGTQLKVGNSSNVTGSLAQSYYIVNNSNSVAQRGYTGFISNAGATTYTPTFVVGAQVGANDYSERLRIDGGGNVGIGTTSPTSPLTVAGVIESKSGGIKFPDGTTQISASNAANAWVYVAKSANFTVTAADNNTLFKVSGTTTATLPAASSVSANYKLKFINTGSGNVVVNLNGTDQLDGIVLNAIYLTAQHSVVTLLSDGSQWLVSDYSGTTYLGCIHGSQTFTYTGSVQTLTLPSGTCPTLTVKAWGGGGGGGGADSGAAGGAGGGGGYSTLTQTVANGDVLSITIGSGGLGGTNQGSGTGGGAAGAFGGGAAGGHAGSSGTSGAGGAGGGASRVSLNGSTIVVAPGGGGGGGGGSGVIGGAGGGGGLSGSASGAGVAGAVGASATSTGVAGGTSTSDVGGGGGGGGGVLGGGGGTAGNAGGGGGGGTALGTATPGSGTVAGNPTDPLRGNSGNAGTGAAGSAGTAGIAGTVTVSW